MTHVRRAWIHIGAPNATFQTLENGTEAVDGLSYWPVAVKPRSTGQWVMRIVPDLTLIPIAAYTESAGLFVIVMNSNVAFLYRMRSRLAAQ